MFQRISRYISATVISLFGILALQAQNPVKEAEEALQQKDAPVFSGVAVSADLVGPIMKAMGADFSQMEVAARLNFKEKYFPVFEMGLGESDYEGEETFNTYEVHAPYFRLGMDYNFTKKWWHGNRMMLGFRYAFSAFKYDLSVQDFYDPVWDIAVPFDYNGLKGRAQWGEVVFGIETRIWKIFRLGWNLRYKIRFAHSEDDRGDPWYVPGFGKGGSTTFGGTFNVIFDI